MYENMVDVLIYLYENYMDGERRPPHDQDALEEELSQAELPAAIATLPSTCASGATQASASISGAMPSSSQIMPRPPGIPIAATG